MAQVLRRHVFPTVRRPFSSSNPRFFSAVTPRQAAPANPAQHPDRRMRMQAISGTRMANDVGLLPNTFIAGRRFPLFKSPKKLLKYQWIRLKTRVRDILATVTFKWMSPKTGRIRRQVQLKRGSIASAAEALYREMYQNFAAGHTGRLRRMCADGLYESFAQRIASRPRGQKVTWNLEKMNRRPKIMSTKAVMIPGGSGNVIRQAVVRISSRQLITLKDSKGRELPGSSEKDIVEYVVVQKIYRNWQDTEWQVWGTTTATTLKNIEDWEKMV
ncbi:b10dbcfb-a1d2-45f2-a3cc-42d60978fe3b [Sclerotinia trifoliorum]|uniref:B10dbcfb-a1d2-45f2-a3cc-42d60978fe3b n=1 Tax=Sclerotinia trifoliorum TaxID=28548 RepID=A0A8H2W013_9HELO|nr:b10dbcfb-a1d2-45f2-a3cc-42d60978fe3b [Sclerotinia trifoliorum]